MSETIFGCTIVLSTGRIIPTRWVGEHHVREDLGFIPSFADWVKAIRPEPWMGRTAKLESEHLHAPTAIATELSSLESDRYLYEVSDDRNCRTKTAVPLPYGKSRVRHLEENPRLCYDNQMKRAEAITRLRDHEAELKRLGVEHLYLFGSTARDEARDESDVDLLFDYEKGKLGLFELMDVKEAAARILGRRTDIMTRDSIHKLLRQRIEATAVPVF
jgi:uncharacterized protein